MNLDKYEHLLKQYPPKDYKKIPAGIYKAEIYSIKTTESKVGNPIIITKFKVLNDYKTFSYIRTLPTETNSTAGHHKLKLLQEYITGLGIKALSELDSVIGNKYLVELSYNKDFTNIKILKGI